MTRIYRSENIIQSEGNLAPSPQKNQTKAHCLSLIFLISQFAFALLFAPRAVYAAGGNLTQDQSDGYYLIEDAADLAAFRDIVNGAEGTGDMDARLTADITLTGIWKPIGDDEYNKFNGTFDGGGHAIYGLNVNDSSPNRGFFGYVGEGGVVKNLSIASDGEVNVTFDDSGSYAGSIVGNNYGTVENCANLGTVSSTNGNTGGIVGYNSNSGIVQNCENLGTVSGSTWAGGIVAQNFGTVQNCTNSEEVSGGTVGGIVGNNGGIIGADETDADVKNCGYLNTSASSGIGSGKDGTNVVSLTPDKWLKLP